jgi:hypothetical protein
MLWHLARKRKFTTEDTESTENQNLSILNILPSVYSVVRIFLRLSAPPMALGKDEQMEGDSRYFYRRFMDDIIVLALTRWHLRNAVRTVNQHFYQLKVAQAPDKTFIGRIAKGFIPGILPFTLRAS